jgi:O-antigen/teichoic acid export membrane protein
LAPPRFEIDKIKEILRFGSGLYGSMVVTQTNFFAADFIIGVFLNPAAVAHYRMGSRMVNAVVDITGQPANKVNWAMMSSVERSASDIADVWPKMYSLFFCIVVSALACLAVIASDVIALFLGPSWAPAATVAVALCAVRALSSFELVATPIFGAKNRTGLLFKIRLAQMVLLLSSILYFARFGPTAAALGHAPAVVFGGVVVWLAIKQITGARNTAWPATIAAPLAVAVLTTFSLWTVKLIVQSITSNMAIVLFVALSVAAIVWLTSMRFLAWNALIKPIVAAWRETPT